MPLPASGLLSNFDDPPEDPLREGGKWFPVFPNGIPGTTVLDMRKEGGQATDQHHGATLGGILAYSYWTQEQFQGDHVEVWGYPTGGQLGAALETWRLFMYQTLNPPTGYLVYVGGGLSKDTVLRKYDASFDYGVLASDTQSYASGLMLRTNGSQVEVWAAGFGSDPNVAANWSMRINVTDTSYRGPFYIGMGIEDPTTGGLGWEGIGGGVPHRTQIYRILPSLKAGELG